MLKNKWWAEKYRPTKLEDFVGNEDFVAKVKYWIEHNDPVNIILYSEKSGTGKTTACRLIAAALDADVLYINASEENGIDIVRDKIKNFAMSSGFNDWKIVILDEFSYFSINAQSALLNLIEVSSKNTRFFFTGNYIEKFLPAIKSRCNPFLIQSPPVKAIYENISKILHTENVSFEPQILAKVIKQFYPDQRAILNYCQTNSITGTLVYSEQNIQVSDYCNKVLDELKSKNDVKTTFTNIRQIISDSKVRIFDDLFTFLFSNIHEFAPSGTQASIILTIADHQYKSGFVLDKEIQVAAMFINILKEIR